MKRYILLFLLGVLLISCQPDEGVQAEMQTVDIERRVDVKNQVKFTGVETQLIRSGSYCSGNGRVVYESNGTYYKFIVGSQGFMMYVGETNSQSNADKFCGQEYIRGSAGLLCESPDGTEQIYMEGTHEYWYCINGNCASVNMIQAFDKCKQWER